MWHSNDGMGWWMLFGGMWMLAFWGLVVWLIVWGVGRLNSSGRGDRHEITESAMDIAKKRLARGEITKEQFDQLKKSLE